MLTNRAGRGSCANNGSECSQDVIRDYVATGKASLGSGDPICANLLFILKCALRVSYRTSVPAVDLVHDIIEMLLRYSGRYDAARGTLLTYYGSFLPAQMRRLASRNYSMIRIPDAEYTRLSAVSKVLSTAHREEITPALIRDELAVIDSRVTEADVERYLSVLWATPSASRPPTDENTLVDTMGSTPEDDVLHQSSLGAVLTLIREVCDERTEYVLVRMLDLDGRGKSSSTEVSKVLGVSRQRVYQIQDKGLTRLRRELLARAGRGGVLEV